MQDSSKQFTKKLLLRHNVKNNNGNCISLDATTLLHVNGEGVSTMNIVRKYELENCEPEACDHDYDALPVVEQISEYKAFTLPKLTLQTNVLNFENP